MKKTLAEIIGTILLVLAVLAIGDCNSGPSDDDRQASAVQVVTGINP